MPTPTNEELNVATWKIPNALGIIGSSANNEFNGMTASWITQVSMEPLLIAVGIDNKSITHGLMSASEYFSLNLFSENYTKVFVKFSKPAEYKEGFLKLEAQFPKETLNPGGSVQGGQMNSLLDDVTSLILIYESKGSIYPSSINLHSHHHRPLFGGKVIATAEIIKRGKNITTIKGELYDLNGKLATTLMHTVFLIKSDFDLK